MAFPPSSPPLLAGLAAARANLLPGLLLQIPLLGVVFSYYFLEAANDVFARIGQWKETGGFAFSFVVAVLAGAVLPELLRIVAFQKGRLTPENAGNFVFAAGLWGFLGICVDALYRVQALWFGAEVTFGVVLAKVLVDQFVYNPFFAAPVTVGAYLWRAQGFRVRGLGQLLTPGGYGRQVLPTLVATWGVWIPAVSIIYSLPPLLQIPLFGFALSFWVLLVTTLNTRTP